MANIEKLVDKIDRLITATEEARGTSADLINASPLEIHLYNIATNCKRDLNGFKAMLEDANGTYMKGKK